jgi:Holliday junction resolvase RusA-like endonuclease
MPWTTLEITGRPVPQPRHRATRGGRMYLPSSAPIRAFKRQVVTAAVKRFTKPITGPVVVEITAMFQRPPSHLTGRGELRKGAPVFPGRNLGDVDNLAKGALDALTGIAWDDDSQVVDLRVAKQWANIDRMTIAISPREV